MQVVLFFEAEVKDNSDYVNSNNDIYIVVAHSIYFLIVIMVLAILKLFKQLSYLMSN